MSASKGKVMWPRLVASKVFKRTTLLGANNFVADFPNDDIVYDPITEIPVPSFKRKSLSFSPPTTLNDDSHEQTLNLKVFVSTWNVGGLAPTENFNMDELIDQSNPCDIYVFGFQEVVPLKVGNVLGPEKSQIYVKWNSLIRGALMKMDIISNGKQNSNFRCIVSKQMVGILISVWVRAELRPYVRNPTVSCVGCGVMGCLGNKGSVSVRFRLHETSFCFVCTHLASGGREGDQKYRNSNASQILSRTIFPRGPPHLPTKILHHQRVIFLGDLNYRISLADSATRQLVDEGDWNALLEHDQLRKELLEGQVFDGWHEGAIKFGPTYKYYPDSDEYYGKFEPKKGQKKRAPAWCDRIIWYGEGLKQHLYERVESKLSDHRPVRAIFSTQVKVKLKLKALQNFFLSDRFTTDIHYAAKDDFPCDSRYTLQISNL